MSKLAATKSTTSTAKNVSTAAKTKSGTAEPFAAANMQIPLATESFESPPAEYHPKPPQGDNTAKTNDDKAAETAQQLHQARICAPWIKIMALVQDMSGEERFRLIGKMVYETLTRDAAICEQLLRNRATDEESDAGMPLGSKSPTEVDRFVSGIGLPGSAAPVPAESASATPRSYVPGISPVKSARDHDHATQDGTLDMGERIAYPITARDADVHSHFQVRSTERDLEMAKEAKSLLNHASVPDHLDQNKELSPNDSIPGIGEKDVPPVTIQEANDPSFQIKHLGLEQQVDKIVKELFGEKVEKASQALLSMFPKTGGGKDERSSEKASEHTVEKDVELSSPGT